MNSNFLCHFLAKLYIQIFHESFSSERGIQFTILTVYGISLFRHLNDTPSPRDLGNYNKYEYEIVARCWYLLRGTKSKKKFDIAGPVCKLQTKIPIKPIFGYELLNMLISRNFAELTLLTSKVKPENFKSISQRLAIIQNIVQCLKS